MAIDRRWPSAAGIPLVVHENFRFMPWFREARRLIDAGALGTLHSIAFRLRPGDGQGPRAYLDRQPYFQQMPRFLVYETAIHFIDTFRYLMGEVAAVTARLRSVNPVDRGRGRRLHRVRVRRRSHRPVRRQSPERPRGDNPRRTMGEMWLEGSAGVLRLDGDARLWWKPHHGPRPNMPTTAAPTTPSAAAPATRCSAMSSAHFRSARAAREHGAATT